MPRYSRNLGHRDALQSWRHYDEDTLKAPTERTGFVFTATHCTAGKGRLVPPAGTAGPNRVGWVESEVLDWLQFRLEAREAT